MPAIKQLSSGTIYVYAKDHPPPHFHVLGNDGRAMKMHIPTLRVLAGSVDRKLQKEAEVWASANMKELQKQWKKLSS